MLEEVLNYYRGDNLFDEAVAVLEKDFHSYEEGCGEVYEEDELADFAWSAGVTKICIILDYCVLKTGYSGYAYDYDEDTDEYLDEPRFVDLEQNTAEVEYKVYERACEEGIDKFFVETIELGNGVFMQERVDDILFEAMTDSELRAHYEKSFVLPDKEGQRKFNEGAQEYFEKNGMRKFCQYFSYDVAYFLTLNLTMEELHALYDFVDNYDINDIHSSNVGFVNGKIKIFDYCGCGSDTASLLYA